MADKKDTPLILIRFIYTGIHTHTHLGDNIKMELKLKVRA